MADRGLLKVLRRNVMKHLRRMYSNNSQPETNLTKPTTMNEETAAILYERTMSPWQHIPYTEQLQRKRKFCAHVAEKLGNMFLINIGEKHLSSGVLEQINNNMGLPFRIPEVIPSPVIDGYRNKDAPIIGLGYDGQTQIGHVVSRESHTYVGSFPLKMHRRQHYEMSQAFREVVKNSDIPVRRHGQLMNRAHWKSIQLRSNRQGDIMFTVVIHPDTLESDVAQKAKELVLDFVHGPGCNFNITSVLFQQCRKRRCTGSEEPYELLYGAPHIQETLADCIFDISPDTFFQVNTDAAEVMYEQVKDMCGLNSNTVLLDVCCGTGTIGIILGKHVRQVIGVERVRQAIDNAIANSERNGVHNTAYICGSAEKYLRRVLEKSLVGPDDVDIVAVVNPSRGGLGQGMIRALRNCEAIRKVIYISCKPLGRPLLNFRWLCQPPLHLDAKITGPAFAPTDVRAIDMFPHTRHFELLMKFER